MIIVLFDLQFPVVGCARGAVLTLSLTGCPGSLTNDHLLYINTENFQELELNNTCISFLWNKDFLY